MDFFWRSLLTVCNSLHHFKATQLRILMTDFAWGFVCVICHETDKKARGDPVRKAITNIEFLFCKFEGTKDLLQEKVHTINAQLISCKWGWKKTKLTHYKQQLSSIAFRAQLVFSSVCENRHQCIISSQHMGLFAPSCWGVVYGWFMCPI